MPPATKLHWDRHANLESCDAMGYIRKLVSLGNRGKMRQKLNVSQRRWQPGKCTSTLCMVSTKTQMINPSSLTLSSFQRCLTAKRGSLWEPIGPLCLVTKITNDSVHFILLACLALPLDTHRLFRCELASGVLCCCSVWPHGLVRLFW